MNHSNAIKPAVSGLVLLVRLGQLLHAVPIAAIEEVLPALPIEAIPQCPPFVRGVISVRGHLIPVLSAAERLQLKNYQRAAEPHIVCVRVQGRLIGVEVDEALELLDLGPASLSPAEDIGAWPGFFAGGVEWNGRVIRILDPERLLTTEETAQLRDLPRTV